MTRSEVIEVNTVRQVVPLKAKFITAETFFTYGFSVKAHQFESAFGMRIACDAEMCIRYNRIRVNAYLQFLIMVVDARLRGIEHPEIISYYAIITGAQVSQSADAESHCIGSRCSEEARLLRP